MIYKPDRLARSLAQLHASLEAVRIRGVILEVLAGIGAGVHHPHVDQSLFTTVTVAAELEREMSRQRTLAGLEEARARGRQGGRPPSIDQTALSTALLLRAQGEPISDIARRLAVGRSTLYRAMKRVTADVVDHG